MAKRSFLTEFGYLFGKIIDAIAYYLVNTPISKLAIRTLLIGGVTVLTLGPITALIYHAVTGNPLDGVQIPVGFTLLALAFLIFLIDQAVARHRKPEVFVEPISSFFKPKKVQDRDSDPKYVDGNGFAITAHFRIKAGNSDVRLIKAELYGFSAGLSLSATWQTYWLSGEKILFVNDQQIDGRTRICQSCRLDGNYHFLPAIEIPASAFRELSVRRDFYGPFPSEGAPIDFGNADLRLRLLYDYDGTTSQSDFFFSSSYQNNGLEAVSEIGSISYFSDREITFWHAKDAINREELESLISIDQEIRRKIIKINESADDLYNRYRHANATHSSIMLLKNLAQRYRELPEFDPDAIWKTPHGRLAQFLLKWLARVK